MQCLSKFDSRCHKQTSQFEPVQMILVMDRAGQSSSSALKFLQPPSPGVKHLELEVQQKTSGLHEAEGDRERRKRRSSSFDDLATRNLRIVVDKSEPSFWEKVENNPSVWETSADLTLRSGSEDPDAEEEIELC